ncbi:MAG: FtsX-like permease family protein [Clostridia bacterium]|nr:FtsX-like permease family protein [Clostridia bacterium]
MIKSVISKIKSNIWMFICLIVGSLLITGVMACIPMYTMGTLRQMLSTEMKAYERENGRPSGQLYFTGKIPVQDFRDTRGRRALEMEKIVIGGISETDVGVINSFTQLYVGTLSVERQGETFNFSTGWQISAIDGIEDNITIIDGRMYSEHMEDDVIEVIVEKSVWEEQRNVTLGGIYSMKREGRFVSVMPVGVFEVTDISSPFWYNTEKLFNENVFCARTAFEESFFTGDQAELLSGVNIYANLDFTKVGIDNLSTFVSFYNRVYSYAKELGTGRGKVELNSLRLIRSYISRTAEMQMSLWILNVPVIAMLAFYMIMVTRMIIEEDRNEISTFKSRGAKTGQIFLRYVIESGFISVFAIVFGPLLGLLLAKTVGNASGFLEFRAREIMPVKLDGMAYVYAIVACVFFSALILIPAISATKGTIVNLKQRRARKSRFTWWEKACVDIICLVISIGLLIIYSRTDGFNRDGTVDPIVYVISTLFILGAGLFFLRIYPFIIALVFKITKRIMPPSGYAAFVQVSRGGNDYRFLMLFLVMTISVGIYSSASARIINNNVENTVKFMNGADAVIHPDFTEYEPYIYNSDGTRTLIPESYRTYPVQEVENNEYVKAVSRVEFCSGLYTFDKAGRPHQGFSLLAIDPYEYGQVSWCGKSLNGASFNEYLNVLELSPMAVLISSAAAEELEIDVGDTISVEINGSNQHSGENWRPMACYVAAIVDYWPTMGIETVTDNKTGETKTAIDFDSRYIIMNFEYLYSVRSTNEFDLYISLEDSAKKGYDEFLNQAYDSGLIEDASEVLVYRPDIMENAKSDSMLKGLNGSYSIGFVSTLTVSFVGFLIYWLMNVRNRKLQFGILRAMGLTKTKLTIMLVIEHLLTTGASVLMGVVIGAVTVRIFAPLLKIAYKDSLLPLDIVFNRSDNLKIYAVVLAMLISGIIVLSLFIRKLKINEAVKIGEE